MKQNYFKLLILLLTSLLGFKSIAKPIKDTLTTNKNIRIVTKQPTSIILNNQSEFTENFIRNKYKNAALTDENIEKAKSVFKSIDEQANLITTLEPTSLTSLPVGIKKTMGNCEYSMGISGAKFTKEYTELTIFVRIKIPQRDSNGMAKELFFGANGIKLSHKGGLVGDTTIGLLGDFPIKLDGDNSLLILKGGLNMATGNMENKTYVTIDCNGFKELGIAADLEFSRAKLEPVDANNKVIASPARVKGSFSVVVNNWNDILAQISLPKFQLTSYPGSIFELETAVVDYSDIRNSDAIVWPKGYKEKYLVEGNENLWRGVYVSTLSIVLPEEIKVKNSVDRIKVSAKNLLIDRVGVSGNFSAENIFSIDEGSASGWQYSLDSIYLNFIANDLTGGGFGGKIILPITNETAKQKNLEDEKQRVEKAKGSNTNIAEQKATNTSSETTTRLTYVAVINPVDNQYLLNVNLDNNISFDVFKSKAYLEKNSYIEIKVKDHKFLPKAMLSGYLAISGSNKTQNESEVDPNAKQTVQFDQIQFQELQLQTVSPYVQAKYFGYTGTIGFANFPVTLSGIALRTTSNTASLEFNIAVNLMENQFNGDTTLKIVGGFDESQGIQKWKFSHIDVSKINIKADIGGAKFAGYIVLRNDDPVYGDGFTGGLTAEFKAGPKFITVEANAIFGSKDGFRYWYVDALASGLNVPCGTFVFKGFGGGAYYRMKKNGFSATSSPSGSNYIPDSNSGLGIKALIQFANSAKPDAFWGAAGFEIAFNRSGGLNRISIYGEGHVMQNFGYEKDASSSLQSGLKDVSEKEDSMPKESLDKLKESNLSEAAKQVYPDKVSGQQGLNAYAAIEYDFTSKTLHGTFDLYINMAGGVFKGRGEGNRAGWAVLHFAPDSWYIRMGTPKDRLGIKMGIGSVAVEAGGYFMIGDDIPGSPPPPEIVSKILGVSSDSLDYMRNENASTLGSGKGFAFGSDFSFTTGDMTFLIFYANFEAGFGFDIMVKDYGEAECAGSGQIGINGWYANGQSYAYLQGEMGVKFKLFGKRRQIAIIKGGAAVVLQAKLPNPVWIKGIMGGNYSLLGGLVKGRFKFQLEFGEQCQFINASPLQGLKAIADITPANNADKVDVFTVPQVAFNMPIGKNFNIDDGEGVKTFRMKLEEYSIKKDGVIISNKQTWKDDLTLLSFNAEDILPPNSTLKLLVKVSFQEWVNGNWQTIYDEGQIATEIEEKSFTTGEAPQYIPLSNVNYCYPIFDQKYFYQKETANAYLVLKQGQPYLFDLKPGQSQKVIYKTENQTTTGNLKYDNGTKKITIDLPPLSNKKPYNLTLKTEEANIDANTNLKENYSTTKLDDDATVEVKSNKLSGTVIGGTGIELITYNFNTSEYNTFSDKMAAKRPRIIHTKIIEADVHALEPENTSTESFDEVELIGNLNTLNKPLISAEAVLDDNYYLNLIYPLVYKGYPLEPDFKLDRDTQITGIPPTKGVELMTWYQDYLINNPTSNYLKERLPYRYNQPFHYKTDFLNIQYKVVNKYTNTSNQSMIQKYNYIIQGQFPMIINGVYNIKLNYVLPGGQLGSSSIFTLNKTN